MPNMLVMAHYLQPHLCGASVHAKWAVSIMLLKAFQ